MTVRCYASPEAFKQALEQRLRASSKSGAAFGRRRQILVFERFLARVVAVLGDAVTLKGGLVLELRIARARTTKDVDLRLMGSSDNVLEELRDALSGLTSPSAIQFSARPNASWQATFSLLLGSRHQRFGSTRLKRTSLKSSTRTRCRGNDPTLASRICQIWLCSRPRKPLMRSACVMHSSRPSHSVRHTHFQK